MAQQVQSFIESNQYDQIVRENGVDHCFILDERDPRLPQAELLSESNRVKLSIFSDQPAIQFYTGKFLSAPFEAYQWLCL
jgi:aldose 1-epimerase